MLFGVPASELTDRDVDLADLWPGRDELFDALGAALDATARMRALSAAVARRLLVAPRAPRAVEAAAERISAARGDLSIRALTADLGVTRQYLARAFAEHVGLSPKMLARVLRARGVVQTVRRGGDVDWSMLALEAGYYDQSHLIGELKELTGLAPTAWAAAQP
jgi:methylphosphotriester-DNA--protein-cysteine methyltransferase